jgi:NAD(P)-dependent dehydrogenase (short-subunit alcohol dehydrogenase family)
VPLEQDKPVAIVVQSQIAVLAAAAQRLAAEGYRVISEDVAALHSFDEVNRLDALILGCEALPVESNVAPELVAKIGNDAVATWLNWVCAATPALERSKGRVVSVLSSPGRYRSSYFRPKNETASHAPRALANGAILGLTRQFALEWAPRGIRLNAVVAGVLENAAELQLLTDRERVFLMEEISLGRPGRPEEIAAAISFLASPASNYVTGDALDVNGGWWMS